MEQKEFERKEKERDDGILRARELSCERFNLPLWSMYR